MSGRTAALVGTLAFVVLLGVLTVDVMARTGFDVLVLVALVLLGMIGFGVVGALLTPPEE